MFTYQIKQLKHQHSRVLIFNYHNIFIQRNLYREMDNKKLCVYLKVNFPQRTVNGSKAINNQHSTFSSHISNNNCMH